MKINVEIQDENVRKVDKLCVRILSGKRNEMLNFMIESMTFLNIDGKIYSVDTLMNEPALDLTALKYYQDKSVEKKPFTKNFFDIPYRYRVPLYKLLNMWTNCIANQTNRNEMRYKGNNLSVAENINMYYNAGEFDYLNCYINIKGKIGLKSIAEFLTNSRGIEKFHPSNDSESPIWISCLERFTTARFDTLPGVVTIYDEILKVLGITTIYKAVQLSEEDLEKLVEHYEKIYEV